MPYPDFPVGLFNRPGLYLVTDLVPLLFSSHIHFSPSSSSFCTSMEEKHQTSSSSDSIHNDKEYYTGDVASVEQQESVEKKEPYKLKRTLKARHLSVSIKRS